MNKIAYYIGLMTVLILSGCSDKTENQKVMEPMQAENMLKTTIYFNHLKNLPPLPEQQQKTVNTIIEGYKVFYGEKDYYTSKFKDKYAKDHQMILRRDGSLDPVEPGAKGRFSYSYAITLHDGSEAELVYQHYNFGSNVYQLKIEKMSLSQCQYLRSYVSKNPYISGQEIISIKFERAEYFNGNKGYSDTTCEKENGNVTIVISSDKMYIGKSYFSTLNNDINRFFNVIQDLLTKNYASAEEKSYGQIFYLAKQNEFSTQSDFLLGIDYFIDENKNTVAIGAIKEEMCKYMVYRLSESPSLTAVINDGKGCRQGLNNISFKLKEK